MSGSDFFLHGAVGVILILISELMQNFGTSLSYLQQSRRVVILECPGGTDKGPDGHRADTGPLLAAFHDVGIEAESIFYTDKDSSNLLLDLVSEGSRSEKPLAFISRVDPGIYPTCTMVKYYEFLRGLAHAGVAAFNHPDDMESLGQKRGLMRLQGWSMFANDTYLYDFGNGPVAFAEGFLHSLGHSGSRVIKQNRGSKGEGIWLVSVLGSEDSIHNSTLIQIVEASTNEAMKMRLGDVLDYFVSSYLAKDGDAILDMPFFPRIIEGEIRLILSGRRVIHVVEKIPKGSLEQASQFKQDNCSTSSEACLAEMAASFSANLDSGAKHTWHSPEEFPMVVEPFHASVEDLLSRMGVRIPPPLWTADFIRSGPSDQTKFVLSEINANCVGFKANPKLAHELVAAVLEELQIESISK